MASSPPPLFASPIDNLNSSIATDSPIATPPLLRRVLCGETSAPPPIWIMRQAGRYLKEYRDIRCRFKDFMEFCLTPDVVSEVTLQPITKFDLDAAIIFCDILMIPHALGQKVQFIAGEGPKLEPVDWPQFLKTAQNQSILAFIEPVLRAIKLTRKSLNPTKSLIGFCGAPWTVACYMLHRSKISNSPIINHPPPDLVEPLLKILQHHSVEFLKSQIEAGCDVIQIFDSWAQLVPPSLQKKYLWQPLRFIYNNLRQQYPKVPIIYYGRGVSNTYPQLSREFADLCFGLDQTADLSSTLTNIKPNTPLQGKLDPLCLVSGKFQQPVKFILDSSKSRPFVFNLGHGILPQTPVDHVYKLIEQVRGTKFN